MLRRTDAPQRARQRGLSIVELMVGVTIGLLVVAAAAVVMSGQLVENRRLLAAAQLQQDLRAAADIMTRELRRSAYLTEVRAAGKPGSLDTIDTFVGSSPSATRAQNNPFHTQLAVTNSGRQVEYGYSPNESGTVATDFGYRLNTSTGTIQSSVGSGNGYQDLTDGNTMKVTGLSVTLSNVGAARESIPCANLCSDGTAACWPTFNVRAINIVISAESKADPSIKREVKSQVRLRNDMVRFSLNAAGNPSNQFCP